MVKKLIVLSLIIVFSSILITADDLNDEEIFNKFINYIKEVYLPNAQQSLWHVDYQFQFGERAISARLLGYALGNLTQYARRGTENHTIALMLEEKIKDTIFSQIDQGGQKQGWTSAYIEDLKQKAWQEFQVAQQGWHDDDMARRTSVNVNNAPNFFDTLAATPSDPPTPPTPQTPPTPPTPPDPPTPQTPPTPPTPPTATIMDEVEGTYKVIGQLWENDPRCGSSVILKGSMIEVEAEFKLWDWTGVTWNYKGSAKWDVKDHGGRPYDLSGSTQNVKYPQLQDSLSLRITLGEDSIWRATSINIGGNHFDLQQTQSTAPKKVVKILTIKNSTEREISVNLERERGRHLEKIGSVDAHSQKSFTNVPERGRWYISISFTTASHIDPHSFTLYVKENQYVYYYEVKPEHFGE